MTMADFNIESLDASTRVIAVTGELDVSNASELERCVGAALADGATGVIVDLTQLTHLDSSGLAALIGAHQRTERSRGRAVIVADERAGVRRTLELRGVQDLFAIAETRDAALAALRDEQPG